MEELIKVTGLTKSYENSPAVSDLSFSVKKGENCRAIRTKRCRKKYNNQYLSNRIETRQWKHFYLWI